MRSIWRWARRDNISDFKPGAQVFKINADGSMSEFASGIRNPVGIAFAPGTNDLYVVTNERDGLGDDLPPDYLTSVKQGGFYGYPYAYIGKNPDPVWGAKDPAARWPPPSRRTCCSMPIARPPGWLSIPAPISRPSIRATPLSRCTAPGTRAIPPATRWCGCISRTASR